MATMNAISLPQPSMAECERVAASIVEWRRSTRSLLAEESSELWTVFDLEHGFDATGRLVAERAVADPRGLLLLAYQPDGVVVFSARAGRCTLRAWLVEHAGWFRPIAIWAPPFEDVPRTFEYGDSDLGLQRILETNPRGVDTEYVYERGSDGRLLSVTQVDEYTRQQLWPVPGRAAIARTLEEVGTLAAPIVTTIQKVAGASKAGVCVLSFSPEDSYVPPVLSWLPAQEVAALRSAGVDELWMTAEWAQTDLPYLGPSEATRWSTLNAAACRKPRAAERALLAVSRSIEAELRAGGFQCVVAALPLEVGERHERLVKKQVSSNEWALLRTWGVVR
ncbi:MAG: hypothetical protein H6725_07680 [Sandaracinaceae bacterium]|nr:hypothetical protein [Sandaracinaceae bacterium]